LSSDQLTFSYVIPGWLGKIDLGECPSFGAYDCELPDLSSLGGEYCATVEGMEWGTRAVRCGGQLGMRSFSIPAAEELLPPNIDGTTRSIRWSGRGAVYQLNIGGMDGRAHVYTSKTSFSFAELAKLGVRFAYNDRRYAEDPTKRAGVMIGAVAVSTLSPYASMDALASGRGALVSGTSWRKEPAILTEAILPDFVNPLRTSRPLTFEPSALLPCAAIGQAQEVDSLRPDMLGGRVTLRGFLTWDGSWACLLSGGMCSTHWAMVGAKGGGPAVLIQRAGDELPLAYSTGGGDSVAQPERSKVDAIATGTLFPYEDDDVTESRTLYLLDDASVCAARPSP
jgi:hypothetical protein